MYILFDIGATKIRFARSDDLRNFDEPLIKENPGDYMSAVVLIKEMIEELANGDEIKGICGGIAGVYDEENEKLVFSPNMKDWVNKPLGKDIFRITGLKPQIFNDTQLGGLGESTYGAGHGYKIVAYYTASTGIGGSVIIDGKIQRHKYSFEPGHQIIDYKKGTTLHEIAAGGPIEKEYNKKPKELPQKFWDTVAGYLAIGIHNSIVHWSPDIVVIGGSLMNDMSPKDIKSHLKKTLTMYPEVPEIERAELGDLNGLWGAMAYLNSR